MTREDIIRMAKEAGFTVSKWDDKLDEVMDGDNYHIQTDQVIDLVNLVAAAEREACAQVCDAEADEMTEGEWTSCAIYLANNIRARGEK